LRAIQLVVEVRVEKHFPFVEVDRSPIGADADEGF